MTTRSESLLHYLRCLTAHAEKDAGDADLLERFISHGDESAFTALLVRHGPMVLGVCRRILRDEHDAEDAFQATFLVLARKAGTLRRPQLLASWLYGTARHLASRTRRGESRRRQHEVHRLESAAPSAPGDLLDDLSARELLLALDEELARLPEAYRLPLILCRLEGRTHEEAACLLGWTAGSVKGRVERGRRRLEARMSRRGLALGASLLAMGSMATATVSADLRQATVQKALTFAAGTAEGIAASVLALVESGLTSMTMAKTKLGLILLLALGLAGGTGVWAYSLLSEKQAEKRSAANSESPKLETAKRGSTDRFGDLLPSGALTRLGSIRMRHGGHVMSVAFTPDGKTVVSGGFDSWAVLCDMRTGKRLRRFRGGAIQSVAVDPEGKRLALANFGDGKVMLYELATGKELATCPGHRGGARVVVFSPDGKRLASGGKDKRIRVWDAATLREVRSWHVDRDMVSQLQFTPDGKGLAAVMYSNGTEGEFRFWDAATGEEWPRRGSLADLRLVSFCFSADGKNLLTGSTAYPGLLQLWELATGKEIRTVARIQEGINRVALAPDGKSAWVIAGYAGIEPQQWDLSTGKQLLRLPHPHYIRQIEDFALSPDGKYLATGTYSHDVFLWDTTTGQRLSDFVGHRFLTTAAAFTPDGRHLWTGGFDETIRYWSAASGEQFRLFSREHNKVGEVWTLALRPDGKMLAACLSYRNNTDPRKWSNDVRLWDLITGEERGPLHGDDDEDWVRAVAFSPDGQLLALRSGQRFSSRKEEHSEEQTIRLWDVATGKYRARLRCKQAGAQGVAFLPDGRHVISALDKETIGFWDVETGRLTRRLSAGPSGGEHTLLLSMDGRILVTGGSRDQPLHVWEIASGRERCRIERPNAEVYVVAALSPNCRILAWWDYGQPIRLWDLLAGKQLGELGGQANTVDPVFLTFSSDSRRLASTHSDGTVLIWDVAKLSPKAATSVKISAKQLEELWNELGSADATKAYRALRNLAATPAQSVPLLRQQLPKTARVDAAKLSALLSDLDSERFERRERATQGLQGLGMLAEGAMRRALRKQPSLEVRRRLEQLLEKLESGERKTAELRTLRAIELLELLNTSESQQQLRDWSQGRADDWLTQEAKASLARLAARSAVRP